MLYLLISYSFSSPARNRCLLYRLFKVYAKQIIFFSHQDIWKSRSTILNLLTKFPNISDDLIHAFRHSLYRFRKISSCIEFSFYFPSFIMITWNRKHTYFILESRMIISIQKSRILSKS